MDGEIDSRLKELIEKAAMILRSFGAKEVYTFGSAAGSKFDFEESDIDLAVRGMPPQNFYSAVGEALCRLKRSVDVIDLDGNSAFGNYLQEHGELTRVL
jgi:predicted nucleotidyltransferase